MVLVHNDCDVVDQNQISVGNAKNNKFAKNYDEAMDIAKEIGGVSGEPYDIVPNKYGGYDYIYKRPSNKGTVETIIKDHVTRHPNLGMSRHINVHNGIDNKKWHVFYLGG